MSRPTSRTRARGAHNRSVGIAATAVCTYAKIQRTLRIELRGKVASSFPLEVLRCAESDVTFGFATRPLPLVSSCGIVAILSASDGGPMETRPYFVLGDLLVNLATGALVGLACAALSGPAWNM